MALKIIMVPKVLSLQTVSEKLKCFWVLSLNPDWFVQTSNVNTFQPIILMTEGIISLNIIGDVISVNRPFSYSLATLVKVSKKV